MAAIALAVTLALVGCGHRVALSSFLELHVINDTRRAV